MSSRKKSKGHDRKLKNSHKSKGHRKRRHNENTREYMEPIYFVDTTLSPNGNCPLFFQPHLYCSSQSNRNPVPSVEYFNHSISSLQHPTQLSIGPLYFLPEGRSSHENSVFLTDTETDSIEEKKPTRKCNKNVTGSRNSVGNVLPKQNETSEVVNEWKSQNSENNILIDTPTQYEYEIPISKGTPSRLPDVRWPSDNGDCASETSYFTSNQNNDSWNQLPERESGNSLFPEHPQGDVTAMQVIGRNDDCPQPWEYTCTRSCPTEVSTLYRDNTNPRCNRENKLWFEVPVDLCKERSAFSRFSDAVRCGPRKMNTRPEYRKRMNENLYRCSLRCTSKSRTFGGMTTEESINDLYKKINDIKCSLGKSNVNGILVRDADCGSDGPVMYCDGDMAVPRPICCCCQCVRRHNQCERRQSSPTLTRCNATSTEYPNCLVQTPNDCCYETGPTSKVEFHYSKARSQPRCEPPMNETNLIIKVKDAECQSSILPDLPIRIEKMQCLRKDISTFCNLLDLLSYGNQFQCSSIENSEKPRSLNAQMTQTPDVQPQRCPCPSTPTNTCQCDLNKELHNVMGEIEDSIISKLENKRLFSSYKSYKPSLTNITNNEETSLIGTMPTEDNVNVGGGEIPLRPEDHSEIKIENKGTQTEDPRNSGSRVGRYSDSSESTNRRSRTTFRRSTRNSDNSNRLSDVNDLNRNENIQEIPRPSLTNRQVFDMTNDNQNMKDRKRSMRGSRRSSRFSSFIERRRRQRPPSLFSPWGSSQRRSRNSSNSLTPRTSTPFSFSRFSFRTRNPPTLIGNRQRRYSGPRTIVDALTAVPEYENNRQLAKDGSVDPNDTRSSDMHFENDKLSIYDQTGR